MRDRARTRPHKNIAFPPIDMQLLADTSFMGTTEYLIQPDGPLKIIGELTINAAGELHKALCDSIGRGPELVVDLSEVQVCDTAGLQLLYSLQKTAAQRRQRIRFAAISEAINDAAVSLGLHVSELTSESGAA